MNLTMLGLWFRAVLLSPLVFVNTANPLCAQEVGKTKVVLLGTGAPAPDPERSGPATAIVVNDTAYLVDFGPGVVRRANAAFLRGIAALEPTKIRVAFVTHLHSDHTLGYPDLIFTPWTIGRRVPLEVYGPKGLKAMTDHLEEAYRVDIDTRTNADGNQHEFPEGHNVNAHEISSGMVYKDAKVTVTAFATKHAMESYGYRIVTPGSKHSHLGGYEPDAGYRRGMQWLRHFDSRGTHACMDCNPAADFSALRSEVRYHDSPISRPGASSETETADHLSCNDARRDVRGYVQAVLGTVCCWPRS
jgi:hypothetical protein